MLEMSALTHRITTGLTVLKVAILVIVLRIASHIPFVKERLKRREERYLKIPYQDFWDDYGTTKMFSAVLKLFICDLNKTVQLGSRAPNCKLVTTEGKECTLLDFVNGNRPLVLNFGSST